MCNDLEREGYFVQPVVIPACAVGAPHRRDRVFFIAHRADAGVKGMQRKWEDNILSGRTASDTTCRGSGGTPHESCCENERQNGYETQQPFVRGCVRASSHSDGERCNNRSDNWKERPICYDQKRDSEENQSERTERMRRTCENGSVASYSQCPGSGQVQQEIQSEQSNGHSFDSNGGEWDAPYSSSEGLSTLRFPTSIEKKNGKMRTDALCNLPVMLGEHHSQNGGKTSQLNPLFVAEMMGFPPDWTVLPFQSGGRNR